MRKVGNRYVCETSFLTQRKTLIGALEFPAAITSLFHVLDNILSCSASNACNQSASVIFSSLNFFAIGLASLFIWETIDLGRMIPSLRSTIVKIAPSSSSYFTANT